MTPTGPTGPTGPSAPRQRRDGQRGIPDGLLVGTLAFLLGLTVLVWTSTGLAALFAHGTWPDGVTFTRTPMALRRLLTSPHDLATAWPDAPHDALSGYGLFWGVLISELMLLTVLTIFVMGTYARWKAVRKARRLAKAAEGAPGASGASGASAPSDTSAATGATAVPGVTGVPSATGTTAAYEAAPYGQAGPPGAPAPASVPPPAPGPYASGAAAIPTPAEATGPRTTPGAPTASTPSAEPPAGGGLPWPAAVPGPRGAATPAGLRYGLSHGDAAMLAVLEAPGPVLVVTSDPGLWADTKDSRAKLGPTHAFDPSHLLDTPDRLRWNPAEGCESRETAAARAAALLAPVRPASSLDSATAEAAETLLRCWLHAAAVGGRPFRLVHRWAQGNSAHEPVRVLRTDPKAASGAAGELEATLTGHPDRRDRAQELVVRALAALSSIHIRDACNAHRADSLALESFIAETGTLYVVGEAIEDPRTHPGAMPLLTALTASVVEHGRSVAERSPAGRLDPPLTCVLDDVAAVAPLPALPELLADGAAKGLVTLALMRSEEQARARWPHRSLTR
ncbi:type VI secretion protein [Streptomyces varsoviensis]|uniref:type VI secretion protein n=1 Tax=Streptomyces varsoviensis TaxID=67373 RepID=UPI0033E20B71